MTAPAADELELSVFGKGIGECLVAHLGDGNWMVVDSFVPPSSKRSIALWYLETLGVATDRIRLVVASHWDDDHIRGLRQVLDAAPNARFVTSAALNTVQFRAFLLAHQQRTVSGRYSSGTREFVRALELLKDRGSHTPIWAARDMLLWQDDGARVSSLSPSPASISDGFAAAGAFPSTPRVGDSVRQLTPNGSSVVLWIEGGEYHRMLLGADLERAGSDDRGWGAVVAALTPGSEKACVLKVPHHGSVNADDDRIWTQLLQSDPHYALTRYTRSQLPNRHDRARLRSRGGRGYLAGRALPRKRYDPGVARQVRSATRSKPKRIDGRTGHIRFRLDRTKPTAGPVVMRAGWTEQI